MTWSRHARKLPSVPSPAAQLNFDALVDRLTTVCAAEMLDRWGDAAELEGQALRGTAEDVEDQDSIETWNSVIERIGHLRKVRVMLGQYRPRGAASV